MTTSVKFDVAVPLFTALYVPSSNKIHLTFETIQSTPEFNALPAPMGYQIAYKEGTFPSNPTYNDDYYVMYELQGSVGFVNLVAGATTGSFDWTPPNNTSLQWSLAIYPVFQSGTGTVNGRIKLLTYNKNDTNVQTYNFGTLTHDPITGDMYVQTGFSTKNPTPTGIYDKYPGVNKIDLNHNYAHIAGIIANTINENYINFFSVAHNIEYNNGLISRSLSTTSSLYNSEGNFEEINTANSNIKYSKLYSWNQSSGFLYPGSIFTDNENIYLKFTSYLGGTGEQYQGICQINNDGTEGNFSLTSGFTWTALTPPTGGGSLVKVNRVMNGSIGKFVLLGYTTSGAIIVDKDETSTTLFISRNNTLPTTGNYSVTYIKMIVGSRNAGTSRTSGDDTQWWNINYPTGSNTGGCYFNNSFYITTPNNGILRWSRETPIKSETIITGSYTDVVGASDGYLYAIQGRAIVKIDLTTKIKTVFVGDVALAGDIDGNGTTARFQNPRSIIFNNVDGNLYVVDSMNYDASYNKIKQVKLNGDVSNFTFSVLQDTEEENDKAGDGDVSDDGSGNKGLGISGYIADVPPYNSVTPSPVTVRDPENNIIGVIPMPAGLESNPVITFRKNGDRLYVLINGRVIWTYRLTPYQLYNFNSTLYRGWYSYNSRTEIETPIESITYPVFDALHYVFNGEVVEPMASNDILFTYAKNHVGQSLIVYPNGDVIVDRVIDNDDVINTENFVVRGGRKYKIATNQYASSPLLPRYIVDYIIQSGMYDYLQEIEVA